MTQTTVPAPTPADVPAAVRAVTTQAEAPRSTPEEPAVPPAAILLVDDEPKNLTALTVVLEAPDRRLVLAGSGEEALKHILLEDFAVIILDVHMPALDGFETAAIIRARDRSRNVPIIFLTAAIRDDAQVARGYSLGAVDYILKPFDPDILRTKVSVFVDLYRAAEERQRLVEERAAREAAEAAQRRFAFLAEASSILGSSLECNETLQSVARLAVPTLADLCLIDLAEEDGKLTRVSVIANGAEGSARAEVLRACPPDGLAESVVRRALRGGRAIHLASVTATDIRRFAGGKGRCQRALEALGPVSALVLPLVARDRTLGVITLLTCRESGRVYSEDDLQLGQDLARRAALSVDNSRLYGEAQAAVRVRDEFLSSATHDLKTPLTVIKAQAQLLQRRAARSSGPDAEKMAEESGRISVATTKMVSLVDQMLDVASLQMGKPIELRRLDTDLVQLAHEAARELTEPGGRHRIVVTATKAKIIGRWDAARLERVFGNLLSNALKYSPAGGEVGVVVDEVEGDDGQPWATLSVTDPGVGIPNDELAHVFDRFFRARNVVGRIAGTGIGLAGVRQIVEDHGGRISIASEEGKGTTVTVHLPLDLEIERPKHR